MLYLTLTVLAAIGPSFSEREHKVHNIVLYPDKHSWCQTTPIKQVVALPGYEPMTIDNNVCVGACYSYSIPRTQPAEPGELIGPYCDSCQPDGTRCYHVNLKADPKNTDGPRSIQKRVQIITNCTCLSCEKIKTTDCEILDESTSELPPDLFAMLYGNNTNLTLDIIQQNAEDVPELLSLPKNDSDVNLNETHLKNERRQQLKDRLVQMMKDFAVGSVVDFDRNVLENMVNVLENSKNDVNEQEIIDDFNVNLAKVREALINIKRDQELMEKHRTFGLGNRVNVDIAKNNADINRDLESLGKTYNVKNFGIEGSHAGLGHYKGHHIAMGIQETPRDSNAIPESVHKSHHHYVGEVQRVGLETGHLIKGPHDSLVLSPNVKVEEKLHLESDNVKPNQEGVVIDYENHPRHL